jgi:hypothetical protein
MSTAEGERRLNAARLTHAKRMIETILEGWDLLTWNELLQMMSSCRSGAWVDFASKPGLTRNQRFELSRLNAGEFLGHRVMYPAEDGATPTFPISW